MTKHKDAPKDEVKVSDLLTEVDKLQEENKARAEMEKLADSLNLRQSDLAEENRNTLFYMNIFAGFAGPIQ